MTVAMVAMRPRKMSQGLTTAGALAVAAFVALYFPNRDDTGGAIFGAAFAFCASRSEEHTSELQSLAYLVCRLLPEKKKMSAAYPATCVADDVEPLANAVRL